MRKKCAKKIQENIQIIINQAIKCVDANAWKVCKGRKPFAGSNPALSAENVLIKFSTETMVSTFFFFYLADNIVLEKTTPRHRCRGAMYV